jgi:acyl-[acyl-carrier-protein]-phospholipid O-acyltransferase/long-chain-fatty-acid--[acyl-carrier-protein] ligase
MGVSIIRRLSGDFIRLVGGALIRWIYRIELLHPERLPATGGALLLPNHITFADGFFIVAACRQRIRFVMDEAFVAKRSVRLFTALFQTVTIRVNKPREAIRTTIEALQSGDLVCLFPEGQLTRTGALNELKRGCELIAKKAGHPLIPLWCDGAWGSIFSYERGKFFGKWPYWKRPGIIVALGHPILPETVDIEIIRHEMLVASAEAISKRFESARWGTRLPRVNGTAPKNLGAAAIRRMWINGYQISQVSTLQWRKAFSILNDDPVSASMPSLRLAFPSLTEAEVKSHDRVDGELAASWVGGDRLREALGHTELSGEIVFYDFGQQALDPVCRAGVLHCPCLAVDGMVIAMSMPDPTKPWTDSEPQLGHKPGTWGKLLPGWFLISSENGGFRAHGPAAPENGLELPAGAFLDAEGFLGRAP